MYKREQFDHLPEEQKECLIRHAERLRKTHHAKTLSDDDLALCIWYSEQIMPSEDHQLPESNDVLDKYLEFVAWCAELKQEWVHRRLY